MRGGGLGAHGPQNCYKLTLCSGWISGCYACNDGPLPPPANAPKGGPPSHAGRADPRGRRSNCRAAAPDGPQAGRPRPPARREARGGRGGYARGPARRRGEAGQAPGAEGAQHGHHPTGPLCAPEHLRGGRPGRSRAGQKARPRSARRAWPCLLNGRRKRPHRCPAGACGSMKRGRGPAGRRTAAEGERPRRRHRPPERGGRTPAWWPALPILSSAPRRGTQGGRGFRGRGAPEAQGAPSWEQLSGSSAAR